MTDQIAPVPQAGWYPDPEDSIKYLRYWDGQQWTVRQLQPRAQLGDGSAWGADGRGTQSPALAATWTHRPLGSGFQTLGAFVRVGLRLVGLVTVVQAGLYVWGLSMIDDAVATGDLDSLDTYDNLDLLLSILLLVVLVTAGISWMVWQYRLARSATPGQLRRGPGWHAFAWITPVVGVWFPFQNVRDLWVRRFPDRSRTILGWWWAGWTATIILDRVYLTSMDTADSIGEFKTMVGVGLSSNMITIVTLVLALRIQSALSAAERTPAVSPEVRPAG